MRLDFNVLWVEDQRSAVQSQHDRIELQLKKEGFRLQVKFASSVAEAKKFLSDDIYGDHIDLILMDYDLGLGPKGDVGIVDVRERFPYKDIIFYSSGALDLSSLFDSKKGQGVYISSRDELISTVEGVFEALVKKVLDIDHSRGLIMGATSDIDNLVNECLLCVFEKCDQDKKNKIIETVRKQIPKMEKKFSSAFDKIKVIEHVSDLFDKHAVYTSVDRLRLLRKALKLGGAFSDEGSDSKMQDYEENIMPKRNVLAHVKVKTSGFSRKLIDRKGNELTSSEMKDLRQALLDNQEMFEKILKVLSNSPQPK